MRKSVLIACEYSGIVRDAFLSKGWDAISCDLLATESPGPHIQKDVLEVIKERSWDMMIAFPPCTYLCSSGLWRCNYDFRRAIKREEALYFIKLLMSANIEKIAIENPIGCISTRIRPFDQKIQPYQFGEDASKATCLWLKNLPILKPTKYIPGREVIYNNKKVIRWSNQLDSGQNRLGPSPTRGKDRSKTYQGIANAMADQWG